MSSFACISVKIVFLTTILIEICYAEEVAERNCLGNGLTPDDESAEGFFDSFATELQYYTGLSRTPFETQLTCDDMPCIINPNGTAIWEARMDLYMNNMMSNTNDSKYTLDGCLCFSEDYDDYQVCMEQVRTTMKAQLETFLIPRFKDIVQSNCTTLYPENCS